MFDSTCTSGGCRSPIPSSTVMSLPILEDLRYLRDPIFSFLLLLNKNNNLLNNRTPVDERKNIQFCRSFVSKISLNPREITPQTTSRFPSNHEPASLKPRTLFPQTTSGFPSNHEAASLKPRVGSKNRLEID